MVVVVTQAQHQGVQAVELELVQEVPLDTAMALVMVMEMLWDTVEETHLVVVEVEEEAVAEQVAPSMHKEKDKEMDMVVAMVMATEVVIKDLVEAVVEVVVAEVEVAHPLEHGDKLELEVLLDMDLVLVMDMVIQTAQVAVVAVEVAVVELTQTQVPNNKDGAKLVVMVLLMQEEMVTEVALVVVPHKVKQPMEH